MSSQPSSLAKVPSPCVGICALDNQELCVGCRRTPEEIGAWGSLDNEERREVLARIAERPAASSAP
ncbi:DUF1289 domain-containing protein [Motiliproteus sediminis]|uniref:DUF1289 domain-containing protein n=1 Tax=Motiliproteus sediminis TaxID=1468178 RepID=UPI001AF00A32|nr:DUF1289 domain-containing protein [Motiliproteus sediminis]